jgi:hypothetical protein
MITDEWAVTSTLPDLQNMPLTAMRYVSAAVVDEAVQRVIPGPLKPVGTPFNSAI